MRLIGKDRKKCILNTSVVVFMCITVLYLKYSSKFINYLRGDVDHTVEGSAEDTHVLKVLKQYHLESPAVQGYNITHTINYDPSQGQSQVIREIFADKKDGTFVECGAVDGVFLSNSLYLERALNWRGLLIEADRNNYAKLRSKKRNAYISNTCISTSDQAKVNVFDSIEPSNDNAWWVKGIGKLDEVGDEYLIKRRGHFKTKVQCFPFYSFMLALNMKTLDYFSLDVEGAELDILKTIPFDKIEIKVMSVEWLHHTQDPSELNIFLESKGYHEFLQKKVKLNMYEKIFIKDGVELNHL